MHVTYKVALLALIALPSLGLVSGVETGKDVSSVTFSEHLLKDKYGYGFGIAVADFDGDGKLDLTSADTTNNTLFGFFNDGKGKFTRHAIAENEAGWLERHVVGDVNGDGRPDVVIVKNLHSQIVWFENPLKVRDGKPWKRHLITKDFGRAYDVVLADLAGRGRLDVAASAWTGNQIAWFENPGKDEAEAWTKHVIDTKIAETRTIRAADFNGDGKMDLLTTATGADLVLWYENPGKPGLPWKKHVIDDRSARPTHGHAVDLNGDGKMDVIMALGFAASATAKQSHAVVWYENVGNGTKWKRHVIGQLDGAFEAVAADINGDGKLDIVATSYGSGKVVWFANPGDPRKTPWPMHVVKENWKTVNQVLVADLDGDGRPDIIAVAERGANELRWWRNEGKK